MQTFGASTRGGRGRGRGGRGGGRGGGGNNDNKQKNQTKTDNHSGRGRGGSGEPRGRGGRGGGDRFKQHSKELQTARFAKDNLSAHKKIATDDRFNVRGVRRATVDSRGAPLKQMQQNQYESDDEEDLEEDDEEEEFEEFEEDEEFEEIDEEELDEEELQRLALAEGDEDAGWESECSEIEDSTHRLAVVKCDWDHIRAVDLYAVFHHMLPTGGSVKHVGVYLSDFGKERLEAEARLGPDLWQKPGEDGAVEDEAAAAPVPVPLDDGGDEEEEEEELDDGWQTDNKEMLTAIGTDGEKFSSGKFRKYELDRMRYYYAIATFDSAASAQAVYNICDGQDIEASGVILDLRFVPDEETFDDDRLKGPLIRKLPANFAALKSFKQAALSQSRFRIAWDQDDCLRADALKGAFDDNEKETDESMLRMYLASDSSSDEDDEDDDNDKVGNGRKLTKEQKRQKIRNQYQELLADIGGLESANAAAAGVDDVEEDDDNNDLPDEDDADMDAEEDSMGEDDELNRFSDVDMDEEDEEFDDEEDEEADEEFPEGWFDAEDVVAGDGDGEVMGNVEGKIDLNADVKAQQFQQKLNKEHLLKGLSLGERAEAKYRQKRKAAKVLKRQAHEEEDEKARSAFDTNKELHAAKIRAELGHNVLPAKDKSKSGRDRYKEKAKEMKAEKQRQKIENKRQKTLERIGGGLGKDRTTSSETGPSAGGKGTSAPADVDDRFKGRLMEPRFHIDVHNQQFGKRKDVQATAAAVQNLKQTKKSVKPASSSPSSTSQQQKQQTQANANEGDGSLDFFMSRKQKNVPAGTKKRPRA